MEIGVIGWFWRGLRGHSVTFAMLFASFLLGLSIAGGFGRLLSALGLHWLYVLLVPLLVFRWLNANEPRWIPGLPRRKRIARALIFGSVLLAIVINQVRT